jgi:hypothetical protein
VTPLRSTVQSPIDQGNTSACRRSRAREVAVYNRQLYLGTIKLAGKATAFDSNGKRVGTFTSLEAASDALGGGAGG